MKNKCRSCDGKGYDELKVRLDGGFLGLLPMSNYVCEKCKGTGELDWVEEIVGKRISIGREIRTMDLILKELRRRVVEYERKHM